MALGEDDGGVELAAFKALDYGLERKSVSARLTPSSQCRLWG